MDGQIMEWIFRNCHIQPDGGKQERLLLTASQRPAPPRVKSVTKSNSRPKKMHALQLRYSTVAISGEHGRMVVLRQLQISREFSSLRLLIRT